MSNNHGPLNVSAVLEEWVIAAEVVLGLLAPPGQMSVFLPSVVANNLSSLRIIYFGTSYSSLLTLGDVGSFPNTPAGDSWILHLGYTPANSIFEQQIPITFLSTGEIDPKTSPQSLDTATQVLAQTIAFVRTATGDPTFDVWKLFNWVVVSYYWIFLYDFGQVAPTYYNYTPQALPNFTSPVYYSSTNNIFVNDTLFSIYSFYLRNTVVPFLQKYEPTLVLPSFLPLDSKNSLKPIDMSFVRSYSCLERRIKGWVSAAVSVLVADYALIVGAYSLVLFGAGWWQKNKNKEGKTSSHPVNMQQICVKGVKPMKWSESGRITYMHIDYTRYLWI